MSNRAALFPLLVCWCISIIGIRSLHAPSSLNVVENNDHASRNAYMQISTFKELLNNTKFFIDKTFLLREIVVNNDKSVAIIRPRKWCKSVNLHMIKDFFEIVVDANGKKINRTTTENYKLFRYGEVPTGTNEVKKLKKPLNILKEETVIDVFQGEYPVIYLSFTNVTYWSTDVAQIIEDIRNAISLAFVEHHYLINYLNQALNKTQNEDKKKEIREELTNFKKFMYGHVSGVPLEESLKFLSRLLYRYFDQCVVILLDDYDRPIDGLLQRRDVIQEERDFMTFYLLFLKHSFESNKLIYKGILTGYLPLDSSSFETHTTLQGDLVKFFGFNHNDVGMLLNHSDFMDPEHLEMLSLWFGGHRLNDYPGVTLTNPLPIWRFLQTKEVEKFWMRCEEHTFITEIVLCNSLIRHNVLKLIKRQRVIIEVASKKGFTEACIESLRYTINSPYGCEANKTIKDVFFSYLLVRGFLTIVPGTLSNRMSVVRIGRVTDIELCIPNLEVFTDFTKPMIAAYKNMYRIAMHELASISSYLNKLIRNEEYPDQELADNFEIFLRHLPTFQHLMTDSALNESLRSEENLVKSLVDVIAIYMSQELLEFGVIMPTQDPKFEVDIAMYSVDIFRGVVISVNYNKVVKKRLEVEKQKCKEIFINFPSKTIKFIQINIMSNKTVIVSSQLESIIRVGNKTKSVY